VEKFEPAIVTACEAVTVVGVTDATVGSPDDVVTTNRLLLVAEPELFVTVMLPLVAKAGTRKVSCVGEAEVTVAARPPSETAFWLAVGLKDVPVAVTAVPGGPCSGNTAVMVTLVALARSIATMLPVAS